jgi:hypothetical protein
LIIFQQELKRSPISFNVHIEAKRQRRDEQVPLFVLGWFIADLGSGTWFDFAAGEGRLTPAGRLLKRQSGIEVDTKCSGPQFLLDVRIFFQRMEDLPEAARGYQALNGRGVCRGPAAVPNE